MRAPDYQKERGERQRLRILAAIAKEPLPAKDLANVLHMSRVAVTWHLHMMMEEKPRRLHIASWERTRARPAPMYGPGDSEDAEFLPIRLNKKRQPDRVEAQTAKIRNLLKQKALTALEIGEIVFLTASGVNRYLRKLRADKEVYIKGWRHPGKRGDLAPIYVYGSAPDSPKPRQTRAERYRKEVSTPEKLDRIRAKRRASYRATEAVKRKQNPFSALGL